MDTEKTGTIFILIGLFIYGIHPVVVEFGGLYLTPLFFAGITATMAGFAVIPLSLYRRNSFNAAPQRTDYLRLVLAGLFGTFVAFTCLFLGLQLTSSNNAAIILRSELVFALIFGFLFLGETISLRQGVWMVLMVCGVLLVVLTTQIYVFGVGDWLLLITPAAWATCHTLAKPTLARVSPWTVVAFRNLVGGGLLLLVTLGLVLLGNPLVLIPDFLMVITIVVVEAIVILLAHTLWYAGIYRINLSKATALISPAPLITFLLSIELLNVYPTWWQLGGAALVIAATLLLSREASLRRSTKIRKETQ